MIIVIDYRFYGIACIEYFIQNSILVKLHTSYADSTLLLLGDLLDREFKEISVIGYQNNINLFF